MRWFLCLIILSSTAVSSLAYAEEPNCQYYRLMTIESPSASVYDERTKSWVTISQWLSQFGKFQVSWTNAGVPREVPPTEWLITTHWSVEGSSDKIDNALKAFNSLSADMKRGKELSMYLLRGDCFDQVSVLKTQTTYPIVDISFSEEDKKISYTLETGNKEKALFQVTIPNQFLCGEFVLIVDGKPNYPTETVGTVISRTNTTLVYWYEGLVRNIDVVSEQEGTKCRKEVQPYYQTFGQELSLSVSKQQYGVGDALVVYGKGTAHDELLAELFNPEGSLVLRTIINVNADGNFNRTLLEWPEPNEKFKVGTYVMVIKSMSNQQLRASNMFGFLEVPIAGHFPKTFSDGRLQITLESATFIEEEALKYEAYVLVKNVSDENIYWDASNFYVKDEVGNKYSPIDDYQVSTLFVDSGRDLPPSHARGGSLTFVIESGDKELILYYDDGITAMVVPEFPVNFMLITAIGLVGGLIALRLKASKVARR